METEEVNAIKKFDDPGLVLFGFKPMEKLKLHHHIQSSRFIYPEEDQVTGVWTGNGTHNLTALMLCSLNCTPLTSSTRRKYMSVHSTIEEVQ